LSKNGGRPVGGIGFIIDNNIKCEVNTKLGDWVSTLTLGRLRIIGVYLQYEKDIEAENKFAHQLSVLQDEINKCRGENLEPLIIGDFNVDLRKKSKHGDLLLDFLNENQLKVDDYLHQQSIDHSFRSSNGTSWIDHCVTSIQNNSIITCKIYENCENDSDHLPIITNISMTVIPIFRKGYRTLTLKPKTSWITRPNLDPEIEQSVGFRDGGMKR
jgi:exonuclease III